MINQYNDCSTVDAPLINLALQLPLTSEQDPEIPKLPHLRRCLSSNPERANYLFQVKNHCLGCRKADSHLSRFTLGRKPALHTLEVLTRLGQQVHIIHEKQRRKGAVPEPTPIWLLLVILSIKMLN